MERTPIQTQDLGRVDYQSTWQRMRQFTLDRTANTPDEIWVCEHHPVFTLGLGGKEEHLLDGSSIPLVKTDRGGQITYHGPGQVVVYPLLNLRHYGLKVREYVFLIEQTLINTLNQLGLTDAQRRPAAPGVYIGWDASTGLPASLAQGAEWAKLAALGIKVRNGCAYHGLALNVEMDLSPFQQINPCGYSGLRTVDLFSAGVRAPMADVKTALVGNLTQALTEKRVNHAVSGAPGGQVARG